jgi:serine/threonine-protein kinase
MRKCGKIKPAKDYSFTRNSTCREPMNEALVSGGTQSTPAGDIFGRFRIVRTLAFGGMAQILLAEETRTNQLVVLKRILPHYASNPEFVQFFIHEGRLGQRLRHPNLVQTLEAGQVGDACYIALEFLHGQPAIELLRAAARAKVELPLGAAVRIVADAARGLHHAHTACDNEGKPLGVVHRDVTPHNLFLCTDGQVKVLDFGIAKAASQLHQTRTGTIKGKFAYLAPEQIRGESIDRRVDVFALGIVLHELLTLRPLFRGANDAETLNRVLTLEVPAPEKVRRGVPPGLGAVALRALQRDRDRRLPSAQALADSIEAVAEAEGIDASSAVVAKLLADLCPPEELPATGEAVRLSVPNTDEQVAVDEVAVGSGLQAPLGVPALSASEVTNRDRHRRLAARAALVVTIAGALAVGASNAGSCMARLNAHLQRQEAAPSMGVGGVAAPEEQNGGAAYPPSAAAAVAPSAEPAAPTPAAPPDHRPSAPPLGVPAIAGADATLRVQADGPATFIIDGHAQALAADGALHLAAGRHRVLVSAPQLAFPRLIEVDLKPREAAVRTILRGHGQLRIAVAPSAEVMLDGRPLGVTPLDALDLPEGTHSVTLKNNELGVISKRRLVVAPNRETLLKVDLFADKK